MKLNNTIPFIIAPKKMKYIDIHLSKHVQDLHVENYKILIKGIKVYLDKWRDTFVQGLEDSTQ